MLPLYDRDLESVRQENESIDYVMPIGGAGAKQPFFVFDRLFLLFIRHGGGCRGRTSTRQVAFIATCDVAVHGFFQVACFILEQLRLDGADLFLDILFAQQEVFERLLG